MHHSFCDNIISRPCLGRHMVRRKQESGTYVTTVCMTLPHEVIIILDKIKKQHSGNRSAAAAHIIKDWKRTLDRHNREKWEELSE